MARNQALFGLYSDEGGGRTDIEENFFRGPIALQVLDRKEAGAIRRTLQRARSVSSDFFKGEGKDKMILKVFYYGIIAYFLLGYTNIFALQRDEIEVSRAVPRQKIKKAKET